MPSHLPPSPSTSSHPGTCIMTDDGAMGSLLAAVAVAAASSPQPSTHPPILNTPHFPTKLAPISIPTKQSSSTLPTTLPPPPPPLPPPLPSPPPLPPMSIRRAPGPITIHHGSPVHSGSTEKRKGARIFCPDEKKVLEANYARNKFPSRLHMETLGKAMGKGTEKVRTWYNNRRALDRKLGVDVNRNQTDQAHVSSGYSTNAAPKLLEGSIILPTHVISSPASSSKHPIQVTPRTPIPDCAKKSSQKSCRDTFVNVTSTSIAWAPSISPVTTVRHPHVVASPSPCSSSTRFRTSPLRIRNVRLRIASKEISGEIPEDLSLDNGLEVKFLFGKKRIVYEWYCGCDYADAQNTGGPYAKMEMNFGSITAIELIRETAKSVLMLSFSAFPTLFLQTPESMMKYRIRAQQRQYRKVGHAEFPIHVSVDQHRITMRTDEAARVLKLLCEDSPSLAPLFCMHGEKNHQNWNISSQVYPHISNTAPEVRGPKPASIRAHPPLTNTSPTARRRPFTGFDPSPKYQHDRQNRASVARDEKDIASSGTKHEKHPAIPRSSSCGASGNTVGPASWQSPATPLLSTRRCPPWLTPGKVSGLPKPPFMDTIHRSGSHGSTGHVRRELNFNHISRRPMSSPCVGDKRTAPETSCDQNETKPKTRRKLTDWKVSHNVLPTTTCEQSATGGRSSAKSDAGEAKALKDGDRLTSNRVTPHSSILRVLPR